MRTFRSSTISLGLVNAPVKIYNGSRSGSDVAFNLCDEQGRAVEQVYRVKNTDKIVGTKDACGKMFEGHQIDKSLIEAISRSSEVDEQGRSLKHLNILKFVPLSTVPFNRVTNQYLLGADPKQPKEAFATIVAAMEKSGVAAVCKWMPMTREAIMILYVGDGIMRAVTTSFEAQNAKTDDDVTSHQAVQVNPALLDMADDLIRQTFDAEGAILHTLEDVAVAKRQQLVAEIVAGNVTSIPAPAPEQAPVQDLMATLKASLNAAKAEVA